MGLSLYGVVDTLSSANSILVICRVRDLVVSKGEGAAEALRFAVSILVLWQLRVHSIRVVATTPATVG